MSPARSRNISNLVIIGKDRTAVTVSAKWFGWKNWCKLHQQAGQQDGLAIVLKALRCIVDKPQIMSVSKYADSIIIGWLAKQPNSNNTNNINISLSSRGAAPVCLDQG